MSCVQHHKTMRKHVAIHATQKTTTHMDRRVHSPSDLKTVLSHNKIEHGAQVSEPKVEQDIDAGIRTTRSNVKHSKLCTHKKDTTRMSGLCHKTMNKLDQSDRTLTLTNSKSLTAVYILFHWMILILSQFH